MRGSILDLPLIIIGVFMIGIIVLISGVVIDEFQNQTADFATSSNNTFDQDIINKGRDALSTFDYAIMFIVMALGLATIIFGYFIQTHPIFFAFSLILLILFVIIAVFFTNAFGEFIKVDPISTQIDNFPLMNDVMNNLPLLITGIGILVLIAMYAKSPRGEVGV